MNLLLVSRRDGRVLDKIIEGFKKLPTAAGIRCDGQDWHGVCMSWN